MKIVLYLALVLTILVNLVESRSRWWGFGKLLKGISRIAKTVVRVVRAIRGKKHAAAPAPAADAPAPEAPAADAPPADAPPADAPAADAPPADAPAARRRYRYYRY